MPDGPHNKVKLNVRVSPSKKEEWKDALEEGETLTSLVQRAVDHEVRDDYVPRSALEDIQGSGETEVDFTEVTSKISELQNAVGSLQDQVDDLSTPGTTPTEEKVSDLAMQLLPHIPRYTDIPDHHLAEMGQADSEEERRAHFKTAIKAIRHNEPHITLDGSAQRLANEVAEEEPIVRQALIYLEQRTTENVHSVVVDSTRHWVRGL